MEVQCLMARMLDSGSSGLVLSPGQVIALCCCLRCLTTASVRVLIKGHALGIAQKPSATYDEIFTVGL